MKAKKTAIFSIAFCLVISCNLFAQKNEWNSCIRIIQNDSVFKITKNTDSVSLLKQRFSIRYFGKKYSNKKRYAAQFAIVENATDTLGLTIGKSVDSIPYFAEGTGFAADEKKGYESLFISNEGHHYLTYENEGDKRVDLVVPPKNEWLELQLNVSAFNQAEKDINIEALKQSCLYFIIFIDNNLNGIIDADELKKIKVNFK